MLNNTLNVHTGFATDVTVVVHAHCEKPKASMDGGGPPYYLDRCDLLGDSERYTWHPTREDGHSTNVLGKTSTGSCPAVRGPAVIGRQSLGGTHGGML